MSKKWLNSAKQALNHANKTLDQKYYQALQASPAFKKADDTFKKYVPDDQQILDALKKAKIKAQNEAKRWQPKPGREYRTSADFKNFDASKKTFQDYKNQAKSVGNSMMGMLSSRYMEQNRRGYDHRMESEYDYSKSRNFNQRNDEAESFATRHSSAWSNYVTKDGKRMDKDGGRAFDNFFGAGSRGPAGNSSSGAAGKYDNGGSSLKGNNFDFNKFKNSAKSAFQTATSNPDEEKVGHTTARNLPSVAMAKRSLGIQPGQKLTEELVIEQYEVIMNYYNASRLDFYQDRLEKSKIVLLMEVKKQGQS